MGSHDRLLHWQFELFRVDIRPRLNCFHSRQCCSPNVRSLPPQICYQTVAVLRGIRSYHLALHFVRHLLQSTDTIPPTLRPISRHYRGTGDRRRRRGHADSARIQCLRLARLC